MGRAFLGSLAAAMLVAACTSSGSADDDDDGGSDGGGWDLGDDGGSGDGGNGDGGNGDGGGDNACNACGSGDGGSGDGGSGDGGSGDGGSGDLKGYVDVDQVLTGDDSCFTPGSWRSRSVDPTCPASRKLQAEVIDFESDDQVEDALVKVWLDDSPTGTADVQGVSDRDGQLALALPTCTALAIEVGTDPDVAATVPTTQLHRFVDPSESRIDFVSVSSMTYSLIPSLLGVSIDSDKGIVAGRVLDCSDQPLERVQVVFRSADGSIPTSQVPKYFVDDFPNRDQPWTSDDGLFVVINASTAGSGRVEAWAWDGSQHVIIGGADVVVQASGITLVDVTIGFEDGVVPPTSCQDC